MKIFNRKPKRILRDLPLFFRKEYPCDCKECSKIHGNGYSNDGINEELVGPCQGKLRGWMLSIPEETA